MKIIEQNRQLREIAAVLRIPTRQGVNKLARLLQQSPHAMVQAKAAEAILTLADGEN